MNPGQMVQDSLLSTETFQPEAIICAPASEIEEPQLVAQPGPAEAERHLVEEQHRQLQAEVESLKARLLGFAKQQPAPSGEDEAQARLAQLEAELQAAQQQVKSLSEQLIAAAEGTQFAESKTEDFFQRFVRERRRAADLSSQLSEAGERIAQLNSAFEGHQSVATRMKVHFSKLERVRDMLTSERDRALKERDEARSQVYRLDAELKAVNGEHLSAVSQLKEQLRQFEVLRDELVIERDNALAEIDAVQTQTAELKPGSQHLSEIEAVNDRLQRQLRALESLNEEIGSDRDRLLTELDHERSLYGQLEAENQSLTQANDNLLNSLQSATSRLEEPEVVRSGVSGIEQQAESTDSQPQPEVARPIFTTEEFSDLEQMAGEDLVVIRRIESVVQRWLAAQEDCADGWQISQVNGAHPAGVVSYE